VKAACGIYDIGFFLCSCLHKCVHFAAQIIFILLILLFCPVFFRDRSVSIFPCSFSQAFQVRHSRCAERSLPFVPPEILLHLGLTVSSFCAWPEEIVRTSPFFPLSALCKNNFTNLHRAFTLDLSLSYYSISDGDFSSLSFDPLLFIDHAGFFRLLKKAEG